MSDKLVGKIFNFRRLCLFAPGPNEKKRAQLQFSAREGYPRITVFTGAPGKDGVISGPLDMETVLTVAQRIRAIAKGPKDQKETFVLKNLVYENDKPTKERKVVSQLFIGKDEKGLTWLGLISDAHPKLKFTFQFSDFIELRKSDGQPPSEEEMSTYVALSFAHMIETVYPQYLVAYSLEVHGQQDPVNTTASQKGIVDIKSPAFEDIDF